MRAVDMTNFNYGKVHKPQCHYLWLPKLKWKTTFLEDLPDAGDSSLGLFWFSRPTNSKFTSTFSAMFDFNNELELGKERLGSWEGGDISWIWCDKTKRLVWLAVSISYLRWRQATTLKRKKSVLSWGCNLEKKTKTQLRQEKMQDVYQTLILLKIFWKKFLRIN